MKKNNKGFFLAETIVVLALVTTVIAFVYPNVSKLYENYNTRIKYYDQTEDLLLLQEVYESYKDDIKSANEAKKQKSGEPKYCGHNYKGDGYQADGQYGIETFLTSREEVARANSLYMRHIDDIGDLKAVYITNYMGNPRYTKLYGLNRYLKRLRKSSNDTTSYRLIGLFRKCSEDSGTCDDDPSATNVIEERYASIRIDNPFNVMCE